MGVFVGTRNLEALRRRFEDMLGLDLQVEGFGPDSLEEHMSFHPHTAQIGMRLKDKLSLRTTPTHLPAQTLDAAPTVPLPPPPIPPHKRIVRFPYAHSPNVRSVLASLTLVPSLVRKSILYAFCAADAASNLSMMACEMKLKGYQQSWWRPLAKTVLNAPHFGGWAPSWAVLAKRSLTACLCAS